jgi:hypothetical protein
MVLTAREPLALVERRSVPTVLTISYTIIHVNMFDLV